MNVQFAGPRKTLRIVLIAVTIYVKIALQIMNRIAKIMMKMKIDMNTRTIVNSARKRRPLIRKKARKALLHRLKMHPRTLRDQIKTPPIPDRGETRFARIYLKVDGTLEPMFTTSVGMRLPIEHTTETIMKMQKDGFWAVRPKDNGMVFIMPEQICQIRMELEEE